MYKPNDICVIESKTSIHNGKTVTVIGYTHGKYHDILWVKTNKCKFMIKESSLRLASKYDIIRNMSDKQLQKLLQMK